MIITWKPFNRVIEHAHDTSLRLRIDIDFGLAAVTHRERFGQLDLIIDPVAHEIGPCFFLRRGICRGDQNRDMESAEADYAAANTEEKTHEIRQQSASQRC